MCLLNIDEEVDVEVDVESDTLGWRGGSRQSLNEHFGLIHSEILLSTAPWVKRLLSVVL